MLVHWEKRYQQEGRISQMHCLGLPRQCTSQMLPIHIFFQCAITPTWLCSTMLSCMVGSFISKYHSGHIVAVSASAPDGGATQVQINIQEVRMNNSRHVLGQIQSYQCWQNEQCLQTFQHVASSSAPALLIQILVLCLACLTLFKALYIPMAQRSITAATIHAQSISLASHSCAASSRLPLPLPLPCHPSAPAPAPAPDPAPAPAPAPALPLCLCFYPCNEGFMLWADLWTKAMKVSRASSCSSSRQRCSSHQGAASASRSTSPALSNSHNVCVLGQ